LAILIEFTRQEMVWVGGGLFLESDTPRISNIPKRVGFTTIPLMTPIRGISQGGKLKVKGKLEGRR